MSSNYNDFVEIEYDDELEYELSLRERQALDNFDDGVYSELEENPFDWTKEDFMEDDLMSDEDLDKAEENYFNSKNDDEDLIDTEDNYNYYGSAVKVGSLADIDDFDIPVFSSNLKALPSPSIKTYKRKFSIKEFVSGLFYRGAGCLFFKKENGRTFILLEKRASSMRFGNQWTIPGGGSELKDDCALDTALRESDEEIDHFHKSFAKNYYEKADRLHTSRWFTYRYDYFIVKVDEADFHRVWGPDPCEVSKVKWFNIKTLPRNCHRTIRWLVFIAKIKHLMK